MEDLNPITRTEKLLDGQELTPITRREMFIKRIYDKTQSIPEPKTREEYFLKKACEGSGGDVSVEQLNVSANGTYSESGKAYSPVIVDVPSITTESLNITENGTYTAPSGKAYTPIVVDVPSEIPENSFQLKTASGSLVSFADGSDNPFSALKINIDAVQSGSGDPSPSNIRPISGWSGMNVSVMSDATNKKYFDGLLNGTYGVVDLGSLTWTHDGNSIFRSNALDNSKIDGNSLCMKYTRVTSNWAQVTDGKYRVGTNAIRICDTNYSDSTTFKSAMNGVYLIYELATPTTPTITPTEFSILLAEFSIDGHLYPISWQTEAGEVYGGWLDVVSGVLTKTHGYIASYDGETLPATWISDRDVYAEGTTPTTGAEVVYELATPTTYQLTPTLVKSLIEYNNLFADTGDVRETKYFSPLGEE